MFWRCGLTILPCLFDAAMLLSLRAAARLLLSSEDCLLKSFSQCCAAQLTSNATSVPCDLLARPVSQRARAKVAWSRSEPHDALRRSDHIDSLARVSAPSIEHFEFCSASNLRIDDGSRTILTITRQDVTTH